MSQNIIIPNKDNKVVLTFSGVDLTLATDLKITFGAETYTLLLNSSEVIVDSATQLSLDLSNTSEVGQKFITVTYIDAGSTNGTDITSQELGNLGKIIVSIGTQLIIEDGSIVQNANSFATDDELKAYALIRGMDIPATQPEREALLILAIDYIFSEEYRFKGQRVSSDQELPFPRFNVCSYNFDIGSNEIPSSLKKAQMELAVQAFTSDLLVNKSSKNVAREKLDTLEVEYFSGGSWETVRTDRADAYLKPLYINNANSNIMQRVY